MMNFVTAHGSTARGSTARGSTARGSSTAPPIIFDTPVGRFGVAATAAGLRRVLLPNAARRVSRGLAGYAIQPGDPASRTVEQMSVEQIAQYLRGERREFDLPLDLTGASSEARTVLEVLRALAPYGKMITYGELARHSDCAGGAREVGQIMARNPIPLVIPCHRVVASTDLGGYGGGLELKRRLLRLEGALTEQLSLLGEY
jgi:methylated-DNA-[protein]-cysteine S-methyltransferase